MREKDGGPRRGRQNAATTSERPHGRHGSSPGAPEEAPTPDFPPEFAAAVQVTEFERGWLREHLGRFYKDQLILDVVRRVKAGKEATVYACSAHPSTGRSLIAAKVYRKRSLRSAKNVDQYQEGRELLDEEGQAPRSSRRGGKSPSQKSTRGQSAAQVSWLMHEFTVLQSLHARGADVPEPIAHGETALLMEFVGEERDAAPTLNDIELESGEAKPLFERVLFNIELLLELGWVHGDLSAYNILYQQGRIVLIDFPQVVHCRNNPKAFAIFERDVERVAQYFDRFGSSTDARGLAHQLWAKHVSEPTSEEDD